MITPYTGGCACGAVRYEVTAEPIGMNDCQCRQCQQESGTGHLSHLTFLRDGVTVSGKAASFEMTGDSGNKKSRHFCPTCGAPVYMTFAAMPQMFTIRAASLDDPARFQPQAVTYASRAYTWDQLDPGLTKFATMPPQK